MGVHVDMNQMLLLAASSGGILRIGDACLSGSLSFPFMYTERSNEYFGVCLMKSNTRHILG